MIVRETFFLASLILMVSARIMSDVNLIRKARQVDDESESETVKVTTKTSPSTPASATMCNQDDCNNHGTCLGTKAMPFCICQIGFAGARCQESYCDSARECNSRGFCMGTTNQYTCLCNLGFTGSRCEIQGLVAPNGTTGTHPVEAATTAPISPTKYTLEAEEEEEKNDERQLKGHL